MVRIGRERERESTRPCSKERTTSEGRNVNRKGIDRRETGASLMKTEERKNVTKYDREKHIEKRAQRSARGSFVHHRTTLPSRRRVRRAMQRERALLVGYSMGQGKFECVLWNG